MSKPGAKSHGSESALTLPDRSSSPAGNLVHTAPVSGVTSSAKSARSVRSARQHMPLEGHMLGRVRVGDELQQSKERPWEVHVWDEGPDTEGNTLYKRKKNKKELPCIFCVKAATLNKLVQRVVMPHRRPPRGSSSNDPRTFTPPFW